MENNLTPLPNDLKKLSGRLKNLNKKQLCFIVQHMMRQYAHYEMQFDMCAEARDIIQAIEDKVLFGTVKEESVIKKDYYLLKNAILSEIPISIERRIILSAVFTTMGKGERPTTKEIVKCFDEVNKMIGSNSLTPFRTSSHIVSSVLRLAGFENKPVYRSGFQNVRAWILKDPEDTEAVCFNRLEEIITNGVDE